MMMAFLVLELVLLLLTTQHDRILGVCVRLYACLCVCE